MDRGGESGFLQRLATDPGARRRGVVHEPHQHPGDHAQRALRSDDDAALADNAADTLDASDALDAPGAQAAVLDRGGYPVVRPLMGERVLVERLHQQLDLLFEQLMNASVLWILGRRVVPVGHQRGAFYGARQR